MNVLIVNTYDIQGGAARAAYRLHQSLITAGIDSHLLVQTKKSIDSTIITPYYNPNIQKLFGLVRTNIEKIPLLLYPDRNDSFFSSAWLPSGGLIKAVEKINPDIVHLHWLGDGMIRIEDLQKIKKPIVWSLHDMWAFTGGCHYDDGCGRYLSGCGFCPVLGSHKKDDLSSWIISRKEQTFKKIDNITIVGLSSWITQCAANSYLFAGCKVVNLPNPIDTEQFLPIKKDIARRILKIPADKKIILFGATDSTNDHRKGYCELLIALTHLPKNNEIEFMVFGGKNKGIEENCSFITHHMGHVDEDTLLYLYSAADVVVVPSLQENLSNTIIEALSCGIPVVAFNIGGNCDMIDHKQNGYLADPFNPVDLAEGIKFILYSDDYEELCIKAMEKVLQSYSSSVVIKEYIDLYNSILS